MVIKNLAGNGGREQNTTKTGSEVMVMEEEKDPSHMGRCGFRSQDVYIAAKYIPMWPPHDCDSFE